MIFILFLAALANQILSLHSMGVLLDSIADYCRLLAIFFGLLRIVLFRLFASDSLWISSDFLGLFSIDSLPITHRPAHRLTHRLATSTALRRLIHYTGPPDCDAPLKFN